MCRDFFAMSVLYRQLQKLPNLSYHLKISSCYFSPSWVFFLEYFEYPSIVESAIMDVDIWNRGFYDCFCEDSISLVENDIKYRELCFEIFFKRRICIGTQEDIEKSTRDDVQCSFLKFIEFGIFLCELHEEIVFEWQGSPYLCFLSKGNYLIGGDVDIGTRDDILVPFDVLENESAHLSEDGIHFFRDFYPSQTTQFCDTFCRS